MSAVAYDGRQFEAPADGGNLLQHTALGSLRLLQPVAAGKKTVKHTAGDK